MGTDIVTSANGLEMPDRGHVFPPSIVDRILSCAIFEGHRLLGYMLLSRECLNRCRQYLFGQFDVYPLMDVHRYTRLFETGNLYDYVHTVTIDGLLQKRPERGDRLHRISDHTWITVTLPVLEKLSNVRGLYLAGLSWKSVSVSIRHLIKARFSGVTTLSMEGVDFGNSSQLGVLLQSFTNLDRLLIEEPIWMSATHSTRQISSSVPLRLKYLYLKAGFLPSHDRFMLSWILGNRETVEIAKLDVEWAADMLDGLIALVAKSLGSLNILAISLSERSDTSRLCGSSRSAKVHGNPNAGPTREGQTIDDMDQHNLPEFDAHDVSGSDLESFVLRDEEVDRRPVARRSEFNEAIDQYKTEQGKVCLLAAAARALQLHKSSFQSSKVREIFATIRWAQPAVSLVTIRFVLGLLNEMTTKVILAFDISFRAELDSFPWSDVDTELAKGLRNAAISLSDFKIIVYVPDENWNAELRDLTDRFPVFRNALEEHDIVCLARLVNNRTYIMAQQHMGPGDFHEE